jgi:RNA polymerase sigma-70 factor (ECF subfamily)
VIQTDESEREWIARAQAGDKAAFGQLVRRYERLLVSVAYHRGLDLQTAQDVAQEAWVKAWRALPRYTESLGSLRAWLCRIAINAAVDALRRDRPVQDLDEHMPDEAGDPAGQAETVANVRAVRRAVAQLPAAYRTALVLREYEGLSYAEIAAALSIPPGTVMSRLNYARSRLRVLLAEMEKAA